MPCARYLDFGKGATLSLIKPIGARSRTSASLIGRLGSSTFRLSAAAVSMSLAGSCFSSKSASGPFHHGIRRRGGTIFQVVLPADAATGPSRRTISPHPSSREGHHSTARWRSSFLLLNLILRVVHAAAATCSRVQRNSVPSIQMRCMITANRRARATIASLIGRLGSSTFRLSAATVAMSLTGSRFSSESAPRPFHHGIRGRGGTIFTAALPSNRRQVQAGMRTHLIHRPARDIIPPLGGDRVSFY